MKEGNSLPSVAELNGTVAGELFQAVGVRIKDQDEFQSDFGEVFSMEFMDQDTAVLGMQIETAAQVRFAPLCGEQKLFDADAWRKGVVVFAAQTAVLAGNMYPERKVRIEQTMGDIGTRLIGLTRAGIDAITSENAGITGGRPLKRIADKTSFIWKYGEKLEEFDPNFQETSIYTMETSKSNAAD